MPPLNFSSKYTLTTLQWYNLDVIAEDADGIIGWDTSVNSLVTIVNDGGAVKLKYTGLSFNSVTGLEAFDNNRIMIGQTATIVNETEGNNTFVLSTGAVDSADEFDYAYAGDATKHWARVYESDALLHPGIVSGAFTSVTTSDLSFIINWDSAKVSDWLIIQHWPVGDASDAPINWVEGSKGTLKVKVRENTDYYIQAWTYSNSTGLTSLNPVIIDEALAINLTAPQNVLVESTGKYSLDVSWTANESYWTFVQIFIQGGTSGPVSQGWVPPSTVDTIVAGRDGVTFDDLPAGDYSARVWHKGIDDYSAMVVGYNSSGGWETLDTANAPLGFGAEIQGFNTLCVFWTGWPASGAETWIQVQYWPDIVNGINDDELKWIWVAGAAFNNTTSRYESKYILPRKGDYWVKAWGVNQNEQRSDSTTPILLNAANGYLDIAEETADWSKINDDNGEKPAPNADQTQTALQVGLAINAGGLEFTGTEGFVKHNYHGFASNNITVSGGFFLGKVGGNYGLLIGNTLKHILFDPAADDLQIKIGEGANGLFLKEGEFLYGDPAGGNVKITTSVFDPSGHNYSTSLITIADPSNPISAQTYITEISNSRVQIKNNNDKSVSIGTSGLSVLDLAEGAANRLTLSLNGLYMGRGASLDPDYMPPYIILDPDGFYVLDKKVLGRAREGWELPTGLTDRATFDPGSITLVELAQRVAALIKDLHAADPGTEHGLLAVTNYYGGHFD